jgi:hypothetical protein
LSLRSRGEQLRFEELIPEPAIERLGKAVLPRRSWLDVRRGRPAALAPTPQGLGDIFRAVIRPANFIVGGQFRSPVALMQDNDSPAASLRAQKFPSARSHCFSEACG